MLAVLIREQWRSWTADRESFWEREGPMQLCLRIILRKIRPNELVILAFIHELVEKLVRGYRSTEYPRRFARQDLV